MKKSWLVLGDIFLFYGALLATIFVRYGFAVDGYTIIIHIAPFSIIFGIWMLVFYATNVYELSLAKNTLQFYSSLFYAFIVNALTAVTFFYFIPFVGIFRIAPKTNFFIFLSFVLGFIFAWRWYYNTMLAQRSRKNNTVIIGINQQTPELTSQSEELYTFLKNNPQLGYNATGILTIDESDDLTVLQDTIKNEKIRTVILSPSVYRIPRIIHTLYMLLHLKIQVFNLSAFFERVTGKIPLGAIDQTWFLDNLSINNKKAYEVAKRICDTAAALIVGIIALPFLPFIVLAIKLDSRGSVFYRQQRVGQGGTTFTVIKFRTMAQTAEASGPQWAVENDARTTRIGRILRRTRIDELPQLWNVLRGELSFIGPRPERPEFHDKLKAEIPFYEERYIVKPGLTGWAQIKYKLDFKGSMTIADTAEKVKYDLYYIKNRSLLLDAGVALKTIHIILKKVVK